MKLTMQEMLLIMQLGMALTIGWSCLCRVSKMDGDTRREVRWAMVFQAFAAGVLLGAPFLPVLMPLDFSYPALTTPDAVWVLLLVSIVVVQLVTAKYWREGVPQVFQQPAPRRKQSSGGLLLAGLAALLSVFALAHSKAAAQESQTQFVPFPAGQTIQATCNHEAGCFLMTAAALGELRARAFTAGQRSCGSGTSL